MLQDQTKVMLQELEDLVYEAKNAIVDGKKPVAYFKLRRALDVIFNALYKGTYTPED